MTEAFLGYGSLFQVADAASPSDFVTVAKLNSIKPGKMSTNMVDVTHHESPDAHRQRIAGIRDTAPFTITGNYLPADPTQSGASSKGLIGLWKSREIATCKIVLSDGSSTVYGPFSGVVSGFEVGDVKIDGAVSFTAEITPTEEPTVP